MNRPLGLHSGTSWWPSFVASACFSMALMEDAKQSFANQNLKFATHILNNVRETCALSLKVDRVEEEQGEMKHKVDQLTECVQSLTRAVEGLLAETREAKAYSVEASTTATRTDVTVQTLAALAQELTTHVRRIDRSVGKLKAASRGQSVKVVPSAQPSTLTLKPIEEEGEEEEASARDRDTAEPAGPPETAPEPERQETGTPAPALKPPLAPPRPSQKEGQKEEQVPEKASPSDPELEPILVTPVPSTPPPPSPEPTPQRRESLMDVLSRSSSDIHYNPPSSSTVAAESTPPPLHLQSPDALSRTAPFILGPGSLNPFLQSSSFSLGPGLARDRYPEPSPTPSPGIGLDQDGRVRRKPWEGAPSSGGSPGVNFGGVQADQADRFTPTPDPPAAPAPPPGLGPRHRASLPRGPLSQIFENIEVAALDSPREHGLPALAGSSPAVARRGAVLARQILPASRTMHETERL